MELPKNMRVTKHCDTLSKAAYTPELHWRTSQMPYNGGHEALNLRYVGACVVSIRLAPSAQPWVPGE